MKIRPFREDYTAFVDIWNAVFEDYPISERYARHEDSRYDGARYLRRRFVAEVEGAVSGIHPKLGLCEHRGFRESRRAWESRLDVRRFDPSPVRSRTDAAARGYRVVTVAEEQTADPRWLEKLHDLHMEVAADVPQPEPYTPITVEELRRRLFDHPDYLPGGHYLAKDGDRYVAESNLFLTESPPDVLYQGITGARREYRGRGLPAWITFEKVIDSVDGGSG